MRNTNLFKTLLISMILLIAIPVALSAQSSSDHGGKFGFGVMLGEPTGVTIKAWNSSRSAFDVGAAWSLSERTNAIHLHADYLLHAWFNRNDQVAFYYGIGGRIIFADDPTAGVRFPLGLTYVFEDIPFDVFVEAVPIYDFSPDNKFAGNGAVGIRLYF